MKKLGCEKEKKMNSNHISDKNEIKSEVENTLTLDCFFNLGSFDKIPHLSFKASAKKGASTV